MAIGGLGSISGSLLAWLMLGVTDTLGAFYISSAHRDAIRFVRGGLMQIFEALSPTLKNWCQNLIGKPA